MFKKKKRKDDSNRMTMHQIHHSLPSLSSLAHHIADDQNPYDDQMTKDDKKQNDDTIGLHCIHVLFHRFKFSQYFQILMKSVFIRSALHHEWTIIVTFSLLLSLIIVSTNSDTSSIPGFSRERTNPTCL